MNGIIVFFLSPDNDKLAEPIEYYVENNKTLSFKGIQSTDASIQYLLWKAAHDEAPVNKIITIVSNEVKEKTWGDFQKRVKNWLSEEKLRKDEVEDAKTATSVHYSVGHEVCTAIAKIGGTMPEDLPTPEKSIQQIEKEQMARLKAKAKNGKLMLDE